MDPFNEEDEIVCPTFDPLSAVDMLSEKTDELRTLKSRDGRVLEVKNQSSDRRFENRHRPGRFFWFALSLTFVLVTAIGFTPSIRDAANGTVPIPPLVRIHGALMGAWLFLYVAQTGLAAFNNMKWHRVLGTVAVGSAVALWLSMIAVSANSLFRYGQKQDSFLYDIFIVEVVAVVDFALLFTWGYLARKDGEAHKRLLTFATLFMIAAGLDRMQGFPDFHLPNYFNMAVRLYPFVLSIFVFDFVVLRRIHRITLICAGVLFAGNVVESLLWGSTKWHAVLHGWVSSFH